MVNFAALLNLLLVVVPYHDSSVLELRIVAKNAAGLRPEEHLNLRLILTLYPVLCYLVRRLSHDRCLLLPRLHLLWPLMLEQEWSKVQT